MQVGDFNYELPEELIAQEAVKPKDSSRLMIATNGFVEHKHFYDLIDYLEEEDILVINESKVSRAKIAGSKITGSRVEIIICEKIDDCTFKAHIKARSVRVGNKYSFGDELRAEVIGQVNDIFIIRFDKEIDDAIINKYFELPLPPYIKKKVKEGEYQTVYSKEEGSLAAPTAGLHFTNELLEKLKKKGVKIAKVCLHIDFGTFLPVHGKLEEHKMHEEGYFVSEETAKVINERKGRLICVGTTSVRTLESCTKDGKVQSGEGKTGIFIYPGYKFKNKIDCLVTNFHLPKSTLLMLVSAYYGRERILEIYEEAVKEKYRFYSLGDAMLLIRTNTISSH